MSSSPNSLAQQLDDLKRDKHILEENFDDAVARYNDASAQLQDKDSELRDLDTRASNQIQDLSQRLQQLQLQLRQTQQQQNNFTMPVTTTTSCLSAPISSVAISMGSTTTPTTGASYVISQTQSQLPFYLQNTPNTSSMLSGTRSNGVNPQLLQYFLSRLGMFKAFIDKRTFQQYLTEFELLCRAMDLNDHQKLLALPLLISEEGLEAYSRLNVRQQNDYQELTTALINAFSVGNQPQLCMQQLTDRKQKEGEDFSKYMNDIIVLVRRSFASTYPTDDIAITFIINNSVNQMRRHLHEKGPFLTIQKLREEALRYQHGHEESSSREMVNPKIFTIDRHDNLKNESSTWTPQSRQTKTCFNCKKVGHVARECWNKQTNTTFTNNNRSYGNFSRGYSNCNYNRPFFNKNNRANNSYNSRCNNSNHDFRTNNFRKDGDRRTRNEFQQVEEQLEEFEDNDEDFDEGLGFHELFCIEKKKMEFYDKEELEDKWVQTTDFEFQEKDMSIKSISENNTFVDDQVMYKDEILLEKEMNMYDDKSLGIHELCQIGKQYTTLAYIELSDDEQKFYVESKYDNEVLQDLLDPNDDFQLPEEDFQMESMKDEEEMKLMILRMTK